MAESSIDRKAFHALSCGLYLVSACDANGAKVGCVANTVLQVASEPAQLLVSLNKKNATTQAIEQTGRFDATILSQDATMELIGRFGFRSSLETDKFSETPHAVDDWGVPYVTEHSAAYFSVRVDSVVDVATHYVFVGTVEKAEMLSEAKPLTYAYYHEVLKGKTPPRAAAYDPSEGGKGGQSSPSEQSSPSGQGGQSDASAGEAGSAQDDKPVKVGWRCLMCGYIVEGYEDGLPADFRCPACGVGPEMFERIEL